MSTFGGRRKADIQLIKEGNCFIHIDDPVATAALTEILAGALAIGSLTAVCESVDLQDMSLFCLE